ncbi:transglycosylase SLT domain-containing protein [Maritalea sp.]|uniref:transglycosylase SLT domain-containing protein n=1 Tax=Maritalea sp. TaxID=2003361 RepID=UPI003EF7C03A
MISIALISSCLTLGADTGLISAIMTTESSGKIEALNVNKWEGDRVRPTSVESSIEIATHFLDNGYSVDIGLMGINSFNVMRLGHTIESAYEPCVNIGLGETILVENIQTAKAAGYTGDDALKVALSLYNTGSMSYGFTNGYVDKVWTRFVDQKSYQARYSELDVPWTIEGSWSAQTDSEMQQWNENNE